MEDDKLKEKLAERKEFNVKKRKGPGRPPKKDIKAKSKGGRGVVGRPKGDAAIMNDYKARMLASPKSEAVLKKVFEVALNDEHKHQAACMKMVMDRVAPVGMFEKDVVNNGGRSAIQINITGIGSEATVATKEQEQEDYIEGEVIE